MEKHNNFEAIENVSDQLRIILRESEGTGNEVFTIWPGEEFDDQYDDPTSTYTELPINNVDSDLVKALWVLDQNMNFKITDIVSSVASAVWERAKLGEVKED